MAQAVPISPQQKIVASPSSTRWPPLSSSSQQQSHQRQQEQVSVENSNLPAGFKSNNLVHSTTPTVSSISVSASLDKTRPTSSTIPRQQKPHYLPTHHQSFDDDKISDSLSPDQRYTVHGQLPTDNGAGRRRSYETPSMNNLQQNTAICGPNVPVDTQNHIERLLPNDKREITASNFRQSTMTGTTMVILNADSVISSTTEDDASATVTITGVSGSARLSPASDSKWTSFDDSEEGDEASSRHHSESEHQNLLADVDATSDGGEDTTTLTGSVVITDDDDLIITSSLRLYYESCFDQLRNDVATFHRKRGTDDHCSSPIAASSPVANTSSGTSPLAVWGKHPCVKQFFERSKLDKEELIRIWNLADVNQDGWLNLDEFCVAMHLVVRRVQANLSIPPLLPAYLRPPITPPIPSPDLIPGNFNSGIIGNNVWTHFHGTNQVAAKSFEKLQPSMDPQTSGNMFGTSVTIDQQSALPSPPVVLKDFTNIPPTPDYVSRSNVIQPKPRRVTPDFLGSEAVGNQHQLANSLAPWQPLPLQHSSSVPPGGSKLTTAPLPAPRPRVSTNDSNPPMVQKSTSKTPSVISPQAGLPPAATPKGPPPKPPPRPAATSDTTAGYRHSRSVSLDLSKKMSEVHQQFMAVDPNQGNAPTPEFFSPSASSPPVSISPGRSKEYPVKKDTCDAQVQTMDNAEGSGESNRHAKRLSTAPMLDMSMDIGDTTARSVKMDQPVVQKQRQASAGSVHGVSNDALDDSKDWTRRCDRLRKFNADLERELKKLSEVRLGLEMHLKKLQKL